MSGTTSVPAVAFTATGFIAPAESAIVTGLDADWTAAFGGVLNVAPAEPAGQLIASQAAILGDSNNQQIALYNSVDPAYASGRMQDGIARIYFLTRNPAQPTVIQVACIGLAGVIIPVGASVQDATGQIYVCTGAGTIPSSGTITLSFASTVSGPIAIPPSVTIYQSVPNWNISTIVSGIIGNLVEKRAAFEVRRSASVALNGQNSLQNIAAAVLSVNNVLDVYAVENDTTSAVTIGGVSIPGPSMYISVSGGASKDIANAIFTKKAPGCPMAGNTSVTVVDTTYSVPQPSYTIKYQIATATPIYMAVTIANSSAVPSNALTLIQGVIIAAFSGSDGGTRARIGSTIFGARYYAGIMALGAWAEILSVAVGTAASPTATSVTVTIAQAPAITASQITLTLV